MKHGLVGHSAAYEWSAFAGQIDYAFLNLVDRYFYNTPFLLFSNGTTRLRDDLTALGVAQRFFRIFNSAEIGICKPRPEVFYHVLERMHCRPEHILFVDATLSNIKAAEQMGFCTHHFQGRPLFEEHVASLYRKQLDHHLV